MVQRKWILLALVGVVMISEASGLKCVVCSGGEDGCNNGEKQAQDCANNEESCFVRIANDGNIERGCGQPAGVNTCSETDGTPCKLCKEDGCNKQTWRKCHKCDQTAAATCPNVQDAASSKYCENFKEGDRCYERFENGQNVQRGCESDLSPLPENFCDDNQQCTACTTDGCNNRVSTDFQKTECVQCKTDNDADGSCLKGSSASTECTVNPVGQCFSKVDGAGVLERGCHSTGAACTGDSCSLCGVAGCNKDVFPADRLACHQCKKADDATCADDVTSTSKSSLCKVYKADDKCYSRVTATADFERGCQSDLLASPCEGLENCMECDGKDCNSISEQKLRDFAKCQQCTSDDPLCLAGTAAVQNCPKDDDVCYARINSDGKLQRGCVSTLTDEEKLKCNSESDNTCTVCSEAGCNSKTWLRCHKCEGTDAACIAAQNGDGEFCTNYKEGGKCYERFLDGKDVQRGCESELDPVTENVCAGNQQCKTCTVDGCNKDINTAFQETKCLQCKSDADDASGSCLRGVSSPSICGNPDGKCFSRIIAAGVLERGCRSAMDEQDAQACTGGTCSLCGEAGCNQGVFPSNRLVCHQCKDAEGDTSCSEEVTSEAKSGVCKAYKADDKCYSRVNNNVFERGCQSDLGENAQTCDGTSDCLECVGANCNTLSAEKLKNRAKCVVCDSTDPTCDAAEATAAQVCDDLEDSCVTLVNNNKLERKCLKSLSDTDQAKCNDANDESCVTCTVQGCNVQTWIKCHQCKESDSSSCNAVQDDAGAAYCSKYKANGQCYERLENEKVVRGCDADLTSAACDNNLECRTCGENACNKAAGSSLLTDQRCLQCSTSTDSGSLCLAGTAASQPCKTESEKKCYEQIQTDGHLKRGCQGDLSAAEVESCDTNDDCQICTGTECNKGVFPENRLRCYQCTSSSEESCINELQGTDKSAYCKLYKADDKCYSRDANDRFERGCQSDLGLTADACADIDEKHCESCEGADCNAISKERLNGAATVALNVGLVVAAVLVAAVWGL